MAKVGDAYLDVHPDLSSLNKSLTAALAPGKLGGIGKKAGLAIGVGLGAGLAAGAGGKALFDLGAKFDTEFDKIRVGTGKTGDALDGLEDDFRSVVKAVPGSFGDAGTAVSELARRTELTGDALREMAKEILQLSRITGTDVGQNVAAITRLFGDWSVRTEEQSEHLNKLFRVSQKTGISVGDLSRLMVKFGSPLRSLGFDFEEAAAMFARFEREGVNIQTTLPGFKLALRNFAQPTAELGKKFKELGINAANPREAIGQVFEALKKLPKKEATQLAFDVFGSRAATDMARAVKEGRFEFDSLIDTMRDGSETIDKAETNTRDFAEQWDLLKKRIFVGLEPLATKVFDTIGDGMEELATADFSQIGQDIGFGEIDTSQLQGSVADMKSIIRDLGPVWDFMGDVAKRQILAVAQVFRGMGQTIRGVTKIISGILSGDFGKAWDGVKDVFRGGINISLGLLRGMTAPVREIGARVGRGLASAFRSAWREIREVFTGGVSGALRVLRGMVGTAGDIGERIGAGIARGFRSAVGKIRGVADDIVGIIKRIPGRLGDIGSGILDAIKRGLSGRTIIPKIDPPGPGSFPGIKVPNFARGGRLKEELALVGEEGYELAKLPTGKQTLLGQEGPELRELPVGTRVYSHPETKRKLAAVTQSVIQRLVPAAIRQPESLTQQVVQEVSGMKPGRESPRPLLSRVAESLRTPRILEAARIPGFAKGGRVEKIASSRVSQIVRTPERKFVLIDKGGQAIEVADSAKTIPVQITAPVVDLSAIESPKIRTSVREAVKKHREPGGDAATGSRRIARTSQLAGVDVTPSEVSAITQKWGVNRAVASIGAAVKDKFPAMNIISGFRSGSTTRSGNRSNHAIRAALDLGSRGTLNRRIGTWTRANFPKSLRGVTEDVLDVDHDPNPPDHDDHVHVAAVGREAIAKVMQQGADGDGVDRFGKFVSTAYGPPWGGIQGTGVTKRGTNLKSGPKRHIVAVDPSVIPLGSWLRITPNPFSTAKAFLADDIGGAIKGKRIDFYDWRGRSQQNRWGRRSVTVSEAGADTGEDREDKRDDSLKTKLEADLSLTELTDRLSDDMRALKKLRNYWQRTLTRAKRSSDNERIKTAAGEVKNYREQIRTKQEELDGKLEPAEEPFELGGLSVIGKEPNVFSIAGMQHVLDRIELNRARASLTVPAEGDESEAGIKAALGDDIAAARELVQVREGIHKLTEGFRPVGKRVVFSQSNPFDPTPDQTEQLDRTKTPQERIALLNRFRTEAESFPFIQGTIKQKIEATTDLATARGDLRNLLQEASPRGTDTETAPRSSQFAAFFAGLSELFKNIRGNIKGNIPGFAKGGRAHGWAWVGEEGPELVRFTRPTDVIPAPLSRKIAEGDVQAFARGTTAPIVAPEGGPNFEDLIRQLLTALKDAGKTVNVDARTELQAVRESNHLFGEALGHYVGAAV